MRLLIVIPVLFLALGFNGGQTGGLNFSPGASPEFGHGSVPVMSAADGYAPQNLGAVSQQAGGGDTFVLRTELMMAGLFLIILFGFFILGSAVIHRFHNREVGLIENQLREIREVERQLELRTQELERSNRDLAQFAYVASHDLRAPVRTMKSFAQILDKDYKGKLDSAADEYLGFIMDGAERLETLINDLLTYSRIDTQGISFKPVNCSSVFDQVKNDLLFGVEDTKADVTRDDLPTVMGDGSQMSQLFQNLLSNAIKFHGDDPPRVHVSAERQDDAWLFAVRDNGIGIDPEHTERIFAMFQRLHTQEEYPGTGMGSAICKKILERHGGNIWVKSQLGVGSTFYFTIPAPGDESP